jgi:hypothetical protein
MEGKTPVRQTMSAREAKNLDNYQQARTDEAVEESVIEAYQKGGIELALTTLDAHKNLVTDRTFFGLLSAMWASCKDEGKAHNETWRKLLMLPVKGMARLMLRNEYKHLTKMPDRLTVYWPANFFHERFVYYLSPGTAMEVATTLGIDTINTANIRKDQIYFLFDRSRKGEVLLLNTALLDCAEENTFKFEKNEHGVFVRKA